MFDRIRSAWSALRGYEHQTSGEVGLADPYRLFPKNTFTPFNPSALVTRKGLKIFDAMRRDEQIKSAMLFKKHTVLAAGWEIVSPEDQPPDWEPTLFVKHQLEHLPGTLDTIVLDILTALDYGYSISEKVLAEIDDGEFAGKVGYAGIKSKKPHWFDFRQDEFGNITDLLQRQPKGLTPLDRNKFVVMTYQGEFGNPYGTSDLDAAYRSWWIKDHTYRWLGMMLERYGIPPIFALYDPEAFDSATKQNLKDILKNMQAATSGIIPRSNKDALELWTPELAGQVAKVFIPALNRFDTDISKAILMPGQLGISPETSVGSQARAKIVFDLFMFIIEFLRGIVESQIMNEQIVRPLVALNYNVDQPPRFKLLPLTEDIQIDILKEWGALTGQNVVKSTFEDEKHIRNILDFPEREQDEDDDSETDDDPDLDPGPPAQFALSRKPVGSEKRVQFAAIERELNGLEADYIDDMASLLQDSRDSLVRSLERNGNSDQFIRKLKTIPKISSATKLTSEFTIEVMDFGQQQLRQEFSKADVKEMADHGPNFVPTEAIRFLRTKSLKTTSTIDKDLLTQVKNALILGLQNGESTRETVQRLNDIYEPYVGDPTKLKNGKPIPPHRLEAIARTESTDAFNRGRLVEARRPELKEFMRGMRYSAIIDTRTTEVCVHLDGKVFAMNDPAMDRLKPPRHVNCRSILVPETIVDEVKESDFLTKGQAARGEKLSGKGFS